MGFCVFAFSHHFATKVSNEKWCKNVKTHTGLSQKQDTSAKMNIAFDPKSNFVVGIQSDLNPKCYQLIVFKGIICPSLVK